MARTMRKHTILSRLFTGWLLVMMVVSFAGAGAALPALADDGSPATEEGTDPPPAEEPPAEEPPAEEPPAEEPPAEEPPAEEPPAEEPAADESAAEEPAAGVAALSGVAATPDLDVKPDDDPPSPPPPTGNGVTALVLPMDNGGECDGTGKTAFKIDSNPSNGDYAIPGMDATITISGNSSGTGFNFTATGAKVYRVVVKASTWMNVYNYPGVYGDTGLRSILKDDGTYRGISHVTFCVGEDEQPPSEGHVIVRKYHDEDGDGEHDGGEDWLADWEFLLERQLPTGGWETVATMVTVAPNGRASFGHQPAGTYRITETVKDGWQCTSTNPLLFSHTGEHNSEKWFGNKRVETGTICAKKYEDKNGNGRKDSGEDWLAGFEFKLYKWDGQRYVYQETKVSGDNGRACFEGLATGGKYKVVESDKDGWTHTTSTEQIVRDLGTGTTCVYFGNKRTTVDLCARKFDDANGNGRKDSGEDWLAGFEFKLYKWRDGRWNHVSTKVSGDDGKACFEELRSGAKYKIVESDKPGWRHTTDAVVVINSLGDDTTIKFGNQRKKLTKTFDLNMENPEWAWTGYFVTYKADGVDQSLALTGTGHTGTKDYPYGTEITDVRWYADWNPPGPAGEIIFLGQTGGETLRTDKTNRFLYGARITGTKYHDLNGNGSRQAGEPGLRGWTIVLERLTGQGWVRVDQRTTGGTGYYNFGNGVLPGFYRVSEVLKPTWKQSEPIGGYRYCNILPVGGPQVACPGTKCDFNDFGNYQDTSITGKKFLDVNRNGEWDRGEPPLAGWTIYIDYDNSGSLDPGEPYDTTKADGSYEITGIAPGTWWVREILIGGWSQSRGDFQHTFVSGQHYTSDIGAYDFGNWIHPGCLSGTKFHDRDADGKWDPDEPGLEDWTIYVDYNGNGKHDPGEPSDITDANGDYHICEIWPDEFEVREIGKRGWTQSYPTDPAFHTILFKPDVTVEDVDFGNYTTGAIAGMKFRDKNADGVKDDGDTGLGGWRIYVDYNENGEQDRGEPYADTEADGTYVIRGIEPGEWQVREAGQSGWTQSYPADPPYHVVTILSQGGERNVDFGNWDPVDPSGVKYEDMNANGVIDPGEPGLGGWEIRLEGTTGWGESITMTTTTDGSGAWSFPTVPPGSYTISEVQQGGWTQSFPADPGTHDVTLESGQEPVDGFDFANWEPAGLSGYKLFDEINDRTRDGDEGGLADWTIRLTGTAGDGSAVDTTTVTNGDGYYEFTDLMPGVYQISEIHKDGWWQTYPPTWTYFDVVLESGDFPENSYDFMNTTEVTKEFELTYLGDLPAEASLTVEFDTTRQIVGPVPPPVLEDAIANPAWVAIETTHVVLPLQAQGGGVFAASHDVWPQTTVSNVEWFALYMGEKIKLGDGVAEELITEDFTNPFEYGATLNGLKWDDTNEDPTLPGDGVRGTGEPGIPDWTIELYRNTEGGWVLYDTTTTDSEGNYEFTGLLPGEYYAAEVIPLGPTGFPEWTQSAGPSSEGEDAFEIENGSEAGPIEFGNYQQGGGFELDAELLKSVDKPTAIPGDTLTYTLTYQMVEGALPPGEPFTVVDDFDERYLTVVDAAGGTVADGIITWDLVGPLFTGEAVTITYQLKVKSDIPESVTDLRNTACIEVEGDENPENDCDDASVKVEPFAPFTEGEPFLPFTGADGLRLALLAVIMLLAGIMLRRLARIPIG